MVRAQSLSLLLFHSLYFPSGEAPPPPLPPFPLPFLPRHTQGLRTILLQRVRVGQKRTAARCEKPPVSCEQFAPRSPVFFRHGTQQISLKSGGEKSFYRRSFFASSPSRLALALFLPA
ncbi:hypothetical protein PUN28_010607 [Cardiocondyla obscurior]|uniref:Secreted protein n=1 Tax=Cardiocondyla obscurior TaxID=286306 RepID=A0AAW2FJC8_9HYME